MQTYISPGTVLVEDVMTGFENIKEVLSVVGVGVWTWDIPSNTILWSDQMRQLFELSAEAPVTYEAYLALIPPNERPALQSVIDTALKSAADTRTSTSYLVEHRLLLANGTTRWIEGRGHIFVDAQGRPCRVTGAALDTTDRKTTEEKLRRSEELHRMFNELASDYVYVVDLQHPTLFPEIVTGSFERTTGLTSAEVEAKGGWLTIVHPDDVPGLSTMTAALQEGRPSINEYRIIDGLGQVRWLRDSVRPVRDTSTGKVVKLMGGVQDITERKRLEEQLLQAQKLAAVARLSGGIAHDFNNLLSVVMGSVALLETEVQTPGGRESCDAIVEAAARGAELTRSLLAFARKDVGSPQLVDLSRVVAEAVPMLARAVSPKVVVTVSGDDTPTPVRIDPGQAQLLLLNLAVNASHAMPNGGALRIGLAAGAFGRRDGLPSELAPGFWVRLSVADEGSGIAPDVLPHIFEPFFTTKQSGQGTGLGLSACHGIVQAAKGSIEVASTVGKGTTFTLFLPLLHERVDAAEAGQSRYAPGGVERILLVEDEKPLQRIFVRLLTDLGYTVHAADSAEDALKALSNESFALLISDIVLPGMHGTELVKQARHKWPTMRSLLMSGYTGTTALPEGVTLLAKPFAMARLATQVRALLDGQDSAVS
jgi:two-component system, cell cycle sensor histidine kinase and response regulator CckA